MATYQQRLRYLFAAAILAAVGACDAGGALRPLSGNKGTPTPAPAPAPDPTESASPSVSPTASGSATASPSATPAAPTPTPEAGSGLPVFYEPGITVTTFAGSVMGGADGELGTSAQFNMPKWIAVGGGGLLWVYDSINVKLRKIVLSTSKVISFGATESEILGPVANASGSVFVLAKMGDGQRLFRLDPVFGSSANDPAPFGERLGCGWVRPTNFATESTTDWIFFAPTAAFSRPEPVVATSSTTCYPAINEHRAGTPSALVFKDLYLMRTWSGDTDPSGDKGGTRFFADTSVGQSITFQAGSCDFQKMQCTVGQTYKGYVDGTAFQAQFTDPKGFAVAPDGRIIVADTGNNAIRQIAPNGGFVTTIAGNGPEPPEKGSSAFGAGQAGFRDNAQGEPPTAARFNKPTGVVLESDGTIYVADTGNHAIRKIKVDSADWSKSRVTTLAGIGQAGFADATGSVALFKDPFWLAIDSSRNLYISDTGNHRIRKIRLP